MKNKNKKAFYTDINGMKMFARHNVHKCIILLQLWETAQIS